MYKKVISQNNQKRLCIIKNNAVYSCLSCCSNKDITDKNCELGN